MSLREKIEGNELDLSLNQLKEVPVKDLAAANKATHLDLSCNLIESLPNDFSTLTHLVKIDLSKNKLTELPSNFGNLVNLQYLDLYGNQIVSLPVSFCRLKNLKWLDLKNNQLDKTLRHVAGDCLNEKECQSCAKKVVAFMQSINSDLERERQKQLKAAREKEAIERAKMEAKLEEQRRLKKLEKDKRKAESRAKKEAQISHENTLPNDSSQPKGALHKNDVQREKAPETSGVSCGRIFLYSFLTVSLLFLFVPIGWEIYSKNYTKEDLSKMLGKAQVTSYYYISEVMKFIASKIPIVKEFFLKLVHRYMSDMTYYASEIERVLAVYF